MFGLPNGKAQQVEAEPMLSLCFKRWPRSHGDGKALTRFTDVELLEAKCLRRDARIVSCDEDGRTWKKYPQHYGNHTEASNVTMCSIDLSQNMSSVSTLRRVVWVLSNDVDGRSLNTPPQRYGSHTEASKVPLRSLDLSPNRALVSTASNNVRTN